MIDHPLHVIVKFGSEIHPDVQSKALFDFEGMLRKMSGKRVEVFKEARGDDSRLRASMTPEQRAKL